MVNFDSFTDEFMRIKVAEEKDRKAELKRLARNLAVGAGAYGLGAGTAGLVSRKVVPKFLPHISPGQRKALAASSGLLAAASGLAFADAMRRNKELLK